MQHSSKTSLVVMAMIALLAAPAPAALAAADDEDEIRQVVANIAAAYGSNDVEAYFSYFAEEMTQWWPNARRIGRQEYYDMWTGVVANGGGNVAAEVDDLRIHLAPTGNAGVASYLLRVTRKNAPPERANVDYRMSLTFLKREGSWKAVHLHFSTPSRPQAPRSAEELQVRDTLNRFTAHYGANNLDGYFFFFAPEFDWWGPSGRSDKESYREFWTDSVDRTGGLESAENSDLQVQVSPGGDLAVGSYMLTVKNKNPGSGDRTIRWQMSPTLVKRGGNWKIVHLHFQRDPD